MTRLLAAFFVCALAWGQVTLDQAWKLVAQGQKTEAARLLETLLQREPSNVDAHLLLGSLLMEAGEKQPSLDHLKAGVRLRPRSADARNALGEAYRKFGDAAAAQTAFQEAVALKPEYGVAQLNLGQSLLEQGKPDLAASHLNQAIRSLGHTEDAADALYLRAKIYLSDSDAAHAVAQLQQAVAIRPQFAEAWSDLGQARKALFDDAGALAAFQHAADLNPQDAVALYRLGAAYLAAGNAGEAVNWLQRADNLNPQDQSTLNALQMALRQTGNTAEAAQVKQRLAELLRDKDTQNQNHLTAIKLNNDGAQREKTGDLRGALDLYRQAVLLYPEHVGIQVNYGVALLRLGEWTAGLDALHSALKRDPQNATLRAAMADALSQAPPALIPNWDEH